MQILRKKLNFLYIFRPTTFAPAMVVGLRLSDVSFRYSQLCYDVVRKCCVYL